MPNGHSEFLLARSTEMRGVGERKSMRGLWRVKQSRKKLNNRSSFTKMMIDKMV